MSNKLTCPRCKGGGGYDALVSPHDDVKKYVKCEKCRGKGHIFQMTQQEEDDYHADYW